MSLRFRSYDVTTRESPGLRRALSPTQGVEDAIEQIAAADREPKLPSPGEVGPHPGQHDREVELVRDVAEVSGDGVDDVWGEQANGYRA